MNGPATGERDMTVVDKFRQDSHSQGSQTFAAPPEWRLDVAHNNHKIGVHP